MDEAARFLAPDAGAGPEAVDLAIIGLFKGEEGQEPIGQLQPGGDSLGAAAFGNADFRRTAITGGQGRGEDENGAGRGGVTAASP
jgi:hypothetical protein